MKKRLFGMLLGLFLVVVCIPLAAFADDEPEPSAFDPMAVVLPVHHNEDGTTVHLVGVIPKTNFSQQVPDYWPSAAETLDLRAISTAMQEEQGDDYRGICYADDEDGNRWYLQQLKWADASGNSSFKSCGNVLTSEQILQAAEAGDTSVYLFTPADHITAAPKQSKKYNAYFIWYEWTTTEPEDWGENLPDPKTYTIQYDCAPPVENTTGWIVFATQKDEAGEAFILGDSGIGLTNLVANWTSSGNTTNQVKERRGFRIGDIQYYNYLAYKKENDTYVYYAFAGWQGEDSKLYQTGDTTKASDELAGGDAVITFTATWEQVAITEDQLQEAKKTLQLDALTPNNSWTQDGVLISQWTDTDSNLGGFGNKYKTGNDVTLDETGTIYYEISTQVNNNLIGGVSDYDGRSAVSSNGFVELNISVTFDEKLAFANTSEPVELTFSSAFMEPTAIKPLGTDANVGEISARGADGTYTIAITPKDFINDDGSLKPIVIATQWMQGYYPAKNGAISKPITVSGFALKLRDSVTSANDKEAVHIETTATVTGAIRLGEADYPRIRFQAIRGILRDTPAWQNFFGGDSADPSALALAVQFADWKLADYDLSDKAGNPAGDSQLTRLTANTVVANYPSYLITATAGEGGTIDPVDETEVYKGENQTYTITPQPGYRIAEILVDGIPMELTEQIRDTERYEYTFENVTADHTIDVTFEKVPTEEEPATVQPTPTPTDEHPEIAQAIRNGTWGKADPTHAPAPKPAAQTSRVPQTGDASNPALWAIAMVAALIALAVVAVLRRRSKKD